MTLSLYALAPGVTGVLLLLLGILVFSRGRDSKVHILLSLFCWSLTLWLFGYTNMYLSSEPRIALFWARVGFVGITFIPVFTFHFVVEFLKRKSTALLVTLYLTILPSLILGWTPLVYRDIRRHFWGFYPSAGPCYFIFLFIFVFAFMSSVVFLFLDLRSKRRRADQPRGSQVRMVLIGFLIGCSGAVDYVVKYGIEFYPFGYVAAFLFASSIAYGILRYKLLDIDIIIRKTLVFAGLLAFVFGVFSFGLFIAQEILAVYFGFRYELAIALSIFLVVLGYEPMRAFLINATDKYFFQKKYNYQQILKDASRGMSRIESLEHMFQLVIHFITMKMRIRNAAVLAWQEDKKDYKLIYQRGYEKQYLEYHMNANHPLIIFLKREKEAIDLDRIRQYIEAGSRKKVRGEAPHEYDFEIIIKLMNDVDAACCVPSFLGKDLKNILVLGDKKSGSPYTPEDLNVLFTIAQESAIAIENARLYDEALKKSQELQNINEQLQFSKDLLTKALQETEVANKQLQDTQAQLIHEQKMATLGRLAASVGHEVNNPLTILSMNVSRALLKYRKNSDLRVSEILELFEKMEQNINRIKAVVNTLTGLLKKSEKGKFEPLSLKLILEETLPLVQFQTYLDNLSGTEVDFDVPSSLPLIRGDLERLQEVFLNLFINAYHAMAGKRNRRIRVWAEVDAENSRFVCINFMDNGSGMPEEVMAKIFNYGFTTKPPGKGSGLGLYMCKYIIELHGGTVKVTSRIGEGTTFTLTLPIYEEMGFMGSEIRQATTG